MSDTSLNTPGVLGSITRLRIPFVRRFTGRFLFSLRVMTFAMMMVVAIVPIGIFYNWVDRTSFENELRQVDESHLIIAKNLSSTLSRYSRDALAMFDFIVGDGMQDLQMDDYPEFLKNFNLCHISIVDSTNHLVSQVLGANPHDKSLPNVETMRHLREIALAKPGETVVSGIMQHGDGAHFFIAQALDNGQLALAPWSPKYVIELQKSISFGELGHSMMVDHLGHVIAHPNAEWQRINKDASRLSVVQSMLAGQTGVAQFYSPPMDADMIAGYTFVPETGWGVMVPQPIRELQMRADSVKETALYISVMVVGLAAFVGLFFSRCLAAPILQVVQSSHRIVNGDYRARVATLPKYAPIEVQDLANSFNLMVQEIETKANQLTETLFQQKHLANERGALLLDAQKASVAKSQFVSTISHELRTPLTSIKGSLELMEKGVVGEIPEKAKKMSQIAIKNTQRLQALVDDLLDIEKLAGGNMVFLNREVNVNQLVADAIEANESYAHIHGVRFKWSASESASIVSGDENRLMQVMTNLLSNAAKFSEKSTAVEISVQTTEDKVRISVRDHGIGIAKKDHAKVFQRFVQIDAADIRKYGGTGLGLSISEMIVEHHRGKIGFDSAVGEGSDFWFTLPLKRQT